MRPLGVKSYDDLLALSTGEPAHYWSAAMHHCHIAWHTQPRGYIDESAGREFPRWFPGGRLNWVNTALAWSRRPESADRSAVVAEREDGHVNTVSYRDLDTAVREFAEGLTRIGVTQGERVGLLMDNGVEATVSLMAIASLGAIVIPLFSGFGVDAVVARLSASDVCVLLASTGFARRGKRVDVEGTVRDAWARLPALQTVVWKSSGSRGRSSPREHEWQDVLESGRGATRTPLVLGPDDPFMIIYTSGTTGRPKGVVHTHGGLPIKIAHDSLVHFDVCSAGRPTWAGSQARWS